MTAIIKTFNHDSATRTFKFSDTVAELTALYFSLVKENRITDALNKEFDEVVAEAKIRELVISAQQNAEKKGTEVRSEEVLREWAGKIVVRSYKFTQFRETLVKLVEAKFDAYIEVRGCWIYVHYDVERLDPALQAEYRKFWKKECKLYFNGEQKKWVFAGGRPYVRMKEEEQRDKFGFTIVNTGEKIGKRAVEGSYATMDGGVSFIEAGEFDVEF
jgi:hypothetical protein